MLVSQSNSRIQVLLLFDWMAKFSLLEWMLQELGKTQYFAARKLAAPIKFENAL